jgi:Relaxase/Mobilisation nuclease domain
VIPNVVRGERMAGLMTYLVGSGRRNEHTEPHLVAGDSALLAWYGDAELDRNAALAVARHLDKPHRVMDVSITGGHVWHCSLSLRADEGRLSDEQWQTIATEFIAEMGFDDAQGTKAACRWAAVHHGVSSGGNDHVHVVVDLVREDGTKASIHRDHPRAQSACRALEKRHGLEVLSAEKRATRGWNPAEREAQARGRARAKQQRTAGAGTWEQLDTAERQALIAAELRADQPRHDLARVVRACATASEDEAEFVRRLRRAGVLVRPRFAEGRSDVVTGYSVARRPVYGERPIWYGGGHLGRDLTLPRLRTGWPDTPTGANAAAAEWTAGRRGRRPVAPGREICEPDPLLWQEYTRDLAALREQLRAVPLEDIDTWARVARATAGTFAAWSLRVETDPGPLAATADVLAHSAQTKRKATHQTTSIPMGAVAGAAMLLTSAVSQGQSVAEQVVMLRQLANLAKALHDMHQQAQELRQAREIAEVVRGQLAGVAARLDSPGTSRATRSSAPEPGVRDDQAAEVVRRAQQGQTPPQSGTPVPTRIDPVRPRTSTRPGPDHGAER